MWSSGSGHMLRSRLCCGGEPRRHVGREPAARGQAARPSRARDHDGLCAPCRRPPGRDGGEGREPDRRGDESPGRAAAPCRLRRPAHARALVEPGLVKDLVAPASRARAGAGCAARNTNPISGGVPRTRGRWSPFAYLPSPFFRRPAHARALVSRRTANMPIARKMSVRIQHHGPGVWFADGATGATTGREGSRM